MRRLGPEDWSLYRRVRLEALREAPYAFGSTFEREARFDDETWRHRMGDRARFVATVDEEAAGTVSVGPSDVDRVASITAMWVDPRFRGGGVGSQLVLRAVDWARENGFTRVLLWVAEGNEMADRLYARHGFVRTGSVDEVRAGEDRLEYEMSLDL